METNKITKAYNGKKTSRRGFISQSFRGTIGAGIALSGSRLIAQSSDFNTQGLKPGKPFKLGIIGCGNRSKSQITVLNSVPDIEITALCDVVPHKMNQRAQLIQNGPEPKFYTYMEKMLRQDDMDAVAILLPNHLHKQAAILAFEAGRHVFCEKPMALTVADCNEMIETAERTGKALQIGTQCRHSSDYTMLVDTIRNSQLGEILHSDINSYRADWREPAEDEYPEGMEYWRMDQSKCGGVVYEMGAHIIDANNWIFDSEPVSITSIQGVNNLTLRKRDSMDHGGVLVRYANSALMNYGGNLYNYGSLPPNFFFAENGTVEFNTGELTIKFGHPVGVSRQEKLPEPVIKSLPEGDGELEQWLYFSQVLKGVKEPYPNGNIGRQTVQICEASVRSVQERREIEVRELD